MDKEDNRNVLYDKIRGIAILLVVLGHSIQNAYGEKCFNVSIFNIIYSFHMPLFMFISGFVTYKRDRELDLEWLKKRFWGLVLPFITWILLPFMFNREWQGGLFTYCKNIFFHPDYAYWFLWALFLLCLVNFFSNIISKRLNVSHGEIITIVMLIIIRILNPRVLGIPFLFRYSIFYFGGYYINKYRYCIRKYIIVSSWICGIVWIFTVRYWRFLGDYPFILSLKKIVTLIVSDGSLLYKLLYKGSLYIYNLIIPFGGIALIFAIVYLADKLINNSYFEHALTYLGRHTLEIYILHGYFLGIISFNDAICQVGINFIIALCITLFIILCFQKNKASLLLFGKKSL